MQTRIPALYIITAAASVIGAASAVPAFAQFSPIFAAANPTAHAPTRVDRSAAALRSSYGTIPLTFEANSGQMREPVKFQSHGAGFALSLLPNEAVFTLRKPSPGAPTGLALLSEAGKPALAQPAARFRMRLVGASAKTVRGEGLLQSRSNYLIGRDPRMWRTDVPNYQRVRYCGVYPGTDLVYYGDQNRLEYDFVVRPKSDPSRIAMKLEGAKHLSIDKRGDLVIDLAGGSARWRKPVVYQEIGGVRKPVRGEYALKGRDQIAFAVGRYDRNRPLVIDPVFAYSTYYGGSAADSAAAIAIDHDGNAYITGITSSDDLPGTSGPPGSTTTGFLMKLDPTGTRLVYATYLGVVFGQSIAVDSAGRAYIVGFVTVNSFPVVKGAQGQYGGGQSDGFLMEVNAAGNGLVYSTYLGGAGSDEALGVALGPDGTTYVTGFTGSTNFPTASPLQAANHGGNDVFISRIDTSKSGTASLIYSTYLGGTLSDAASGIAVDSAGRIYVAGGTNSTDFPIASAFQSTKKGTGDNAFLVCLAPNGSAISYSTYLGGATADTFAKKVAVDGSRNAYIVGQTGATDLPIRHPVQSTLGGNLDAFVAGINCAATGDSSLIYSTYIGGSGNDVGTDIAVDVWGNAVVTGDTAGQIFVAKINQAGGSLLFGAAFGGSGAESVGAIALDPLGYAFVTGATNSVDFPVTPGVVQSRLGNPAGFNDAFISRLPTVTRFDINKDTMPDLLFQNSSTGQLVYWQMVGDRFSQFGFINPSLPGANWKVVGSADLNGDGSTDLILQDANTGDLIYWLLNGASQTDVQFISPRNPGANWNVVGVADINRDGYPDIIFQNSATFDIFVWYMKGATQIGGAFINPKNPGAGWKVAAVGDLNNDGQADLLFQNANSGDMYVWFMHGDTIASQGFLNPANPGAGWNVAGLVDLLGLGRPQIMFQNSSTAGLAYWAMNGLNLVFNDVLKPNNPNPGLPWVLVGAR